MMMVEPTVLTGGAQQATTNRRIVKKLILAPHADDESLGCGGVIAKDPDSVVVAVMSDKGDGRMGELEVARKALGYRNVVEVGFKTGTLMGESREVTSVLDQLITDVRPDELYLPTPGLHQDHLATYEAGLRASRKSYTGATWFTPTVLLYEVPSYDADLYQIPYTWSRFVSLSEDEMDRKAAAIRAYGSQANGSFDPATLARDHAAHLGGRANVRYVERYAVVRDIIS
jgi:LmbE family N-acetylglucosaminyl deacetylase